MDKHSLSRAEFSRFVAVDRLEQGEVAERIGAREDECRALAARFGLIALERLDADVRLRRIEKGPIVRVEGRLFADVVQTCVVSLEPVEGRVEEEFSLLYAPASRIAARGGRAPGEAGDDWPEPIQHGAIDIGEAVAQQLALALDLYPRKPGIRLEDVLGKCQGISLGEEPKESPFAVLSRLAKRGA